MSLRMWVQNLSMTRKVLMAPVVIIGCLLLFGALSFVGLTTQRKALHDIYDNRFKSYQISAALVKDLTSIHMSVYRLLSWEVARFDRAKIDELGKEQLAVLDRSVKIIKASIASPSVTPDEKKIYEAILTRLLEYQKAIQSAIDLSSSDLNFATMFMATADEKFQILEKGMKNLLDLETRMSAESFTHSMRTFDWVMVGMPGLLAAALILSLVVSIFTAQTVTGVLGSEPRDLADIARNIADGNLAVQFKAKGTVRGIYADMQKMATNLENTLSKIRAVTNSLSNVTENIVSSSQNVLTVADVQRTSIKETADVIREMDKSTSTVTAGAESLSVSAKNTSAAIMEMKQSVEKVAESSGVFESLTHETSSSIEETVANIKQIAESLEKLSSSSEEIASSVSEVNTSVKEIERHATESVALSEKVVSEASEKGIAAAHASMEGMEHIRSSVGSLSDVINVLGKRSEDIGKILTVIGEVADETTLLSLNAAILAAQAGEHGKAFAVVAGEIKNLAGRTSLSTKEIAALIASVRQETQSSVAMAAEGIQAVGKGLKLVGDVNEALRGIVRSSKESTEMSKAIQRSTSEESKAIKQITDAIREMSKQVENISIALQEQNIGSKFVIEQTEKMKDISSQLNTVIGEQRDGSRQIAVAIENVAHQSEQIAQATGKQKQKSAEMVQFMNKIQNATDNLIRFSNELNETINALKEDSRNLHGELQKFKG